MADAAASAAPRLSLDGENAAECLGQGSQAASRSDASPEVTALWEKDMDVMRESIRLLLNNKTEEAEKHLADASAEVQARQIDFQAGDHDMRGGFAFVGALMGLINGLASMENNQLETVLQKVWAADELLQQDSDWAGKTVLRGLCLLVAGVVTMMQGTVTRGVWHVLRSWLFLRYLESEALNYEGHEKECVRSTALFALGMFNLFTSMLPPQAISAAGFLTGFKGGRDQALVQLKQCWDEQGIQAPFAGLVLIGWAVDVSSFLGELRCEREPKHEEARKILDWAAEKYPDAFFFDGLACSYLCAQRDLSAAKAKLEQIRISVQDLPAFLFVVHLRTAVVAASCSDWSGAAESYAAALEVHRTVGRRALCPTLALNSHMCHILAGSDDKASNMLDVCLSYKTESKKWSRMDKQSLGMADVASLARGAKGGDVVSSNSASSLTSSPTSDGDSDQLPWNPMLTMCLKVCVVHRAVDFMTPEQSAAFLARVRSVTEALDASDVDSRCVGLWIQAEAMRQSEEWEEALRLAEECSRLQPELSTAGRKTGALQFAKLIEAYARHAQGRFADATTALGELQKLGSDHGFSRQVEFKATHLRRLVGAEFENSYIELTVPARGKARYIAQVPAGTGTVEWDWLLKDFTVSFVATQQGDQGELQRVDKYAAEDGPCSGSFEAAGPAVLEFEFDNSFSMLRSKTVSLRVQPNTVEVTRAD